MAKVFIHADLDYLRGYMRYGHKEGTITIPDEKLESFKTDPAGYLINDFYTDDNLKIFVDDFRIEECGDITDVQFKIIDEEVK